ncbi:MAG: pyridoxamine 5'-phosphate oxidase family protein [Synergistaceae bacterium]|jgi:hypothetical protein|nr:pyridoxamine 5'-phosphate oxidase family protein [Synergistaceae bacterium]
MGATLNEELREMLADSGTIAALATTGSDGAVHVAFKESFNCRDDGYIEYDEVMDTSQTNKNLVHSIWFGKTISISVLSKDRRSYVITGRPVRAVISGREFREHYISIRKRLGDVDLSTVWIIDPISVREQSFDKRREEEEDAHPLLRHLDRLTVQDTSH